MVNYIIQFILLSLIILLKFPAILIFQIVSDIPMLKRNHSFIKESSLMGGNIQKSEQLKMMHLLNNGTQI